MTRLIQLPGALWETSTDLRVFHEPIVTSSLGFFGVKDQVFQSSVEEMSNGVSLAVGHMSPDSQESFADSNPRLAIAADAMMTIIEAASGVPAGQPLGAQVCTVVADVITQVSSGESLVGSIVQQAAGAAGDAAAAIPMVGAIVGMIVGAIGTAIASAGISPGENAALNSKYHQYCAGIYQPHNTLHRLRGTGPGNAVEPADMVAQRDTRIEAIGWLAGAASRDPVKRAQYNAWFAKAKYDYSIKGIPIPVQQDIVRLLEGIYAARRKPGCLTCTISGDNGRFLFGLLMQILLDQAQRKPPAWTQQSLRSLIDRFVAPRRQFCVPKDCPAPCYGAAGVECKRLGPCSRDDDESFVVSVMDLVDGWKATLAEEGIWKVAKINVATVPKLSKLVLSVASTDKLLTAARAVGRVQEEKRAAELRKGLIAGSVVLVGGGALLAARRFAKRQRSV